LIKELGTKPKQPYAKYHHEKLLYFFLADTDIGNIKCKYNDEDEKEDLDTDFNFIVKESGIEEC